METNQNPSPLKNPLNYWNSVWSKKYKDDNLLLIRNMVDRINSQSYWDNLWKSPARRVEKYSMQRAWWEIQQKGAKSVLDAGCGNGRLLFGIKQINPQIEVFGIDISEVAIERMKKEYGIEGAVMDVDNIDKLEKTFDFIVANHMLEHLYRDVEFVQKCKEKLNPQGWFYAAVPNNMSGPEETEEHVRKYDHKMMAELLTRVFGNVEIRIIGNHLIGMAQKL